MFVLYCVFANPAFGCDIPINDDNDDDDEDVDLIQSESRKGGSKIERFWTCRRLYLMNGTRYGLGYN